MDHLVALISLVFGLGCSVLLGRYLEERLGLGKQCIQTAGVMGLAVMGLSTFVLALAIPALGLRWASALVWGCAGGVGILQWR